MEYLDRIKKLRAKRGITQAEMSKKLGMAQNNYGKLERGLTEMTVKRLLEIGDILEVTLDDIFYPERVSNSNLLYFERLEKIIEHRDFTIEMLHRTAQESIKELNSIITQINSKEEDKDLHYPLYPKLPSLKGFGYEKYQSIFTDDEEEGK